MSTQRVGTRRGKRLRRSVAGVAVLLVLAALVLGGEALYAAQRTYLPADAGPPISGRFGPATGPALQLVVLGDSTGAALGATRTETSVGGRLAVALAERTGRPVELSSAAFSGARSADLDGQVDRALAGVRPDIAVVLVGANDAIHATPLEPVERDLGAAVRRLTSAGVKVVVGTAPDLGGGRALPRPLRDIAAWRGRAVADVSTRAVRGAGGTPVDLAALTGPAFRADARNLSSDLWHPSDAGYALWADAMLPAVLRAAGE